jgi:molecular chaperone IbpA
MVTTTRFTSEHLPTIVTQLRNDPFLLGFDQLFDRLVSSGVGSAQATSYPPYNIVRNDDSDSFAIEIALAGFASEEIDVTVKEDTLTVESAKDHSADSAEYVHQGIAARNFKRSWTLSPTIKVTEASFVNGLLIINLVNEIPEEKKPKKITINGPEVGTPVQLNE